MDTLDGAPVEETANELYRQWGVGQKKTNEGLLVLLVVRDHKDRVEVGYGLEPILTDGYVGSVLREVRPLLRQGDYGGALTQIAQSFGTRIAEQKGVSIEAGPEERRRALPQRRPAGGIPWPVLLVGIIVILWLMSRGGGGRPYGGYGGGGGFWTGLLLGNVLGRGRNWGGGGWGGGGFGGSDSGGGGFGGFGGGDSGGGGASSDW